MAFSETLTTFRTGGPFDRYCPPHLDLSSSIGVSSNISSERQCGLSQQQQQQPLWCVRVQESVFVVWGGGEALCIELNAAAAISSRVCHRFWSSLLSSAVLSAREQGTQPRLHGIRMGFRR